jgi:hypothetical protein
MLGGFSGLAIDTRLGGRGEWEGGESARSCAIAGREGGMGGVVPCGELSGFLHKLGS